LPEDLTDEAAAALIECLYDAARVLENHYAAQLIRHYHRTDYRQCCLWTEDDPPF
jgi:hypothetical protein